MLNKRAFTIIELLIVIIILGILVLLAAPKVLSYTENAKLAHIKNDIKAYENAIGMERVSSDEFIDGWESVDNVNLESFRDSNSLFDKRGVTVDSEFNDDYLKVPSNLINSKLKGDFILAKGGNVFYIDEKINAGNEQNVPSDIDLGMESDFIWVDLRMSELEGFEGYEAPDEIKGYFHYIGTGKEIVEIPHVIQGVKVTSYFLMFSETGSDVKKVISTNKNVTDMRGMFMGSQATSLDVSELDTSNTENMDGMFAFLNIESLDLSSFNTSNVIHMRGMFYNTEIASLDLSSFDTSNVIKMEGMFEGVKTTKLDLSNFDTSNVITMNYLDINFGTGMFQDSSVERIILGKKFTAEKVESFSNMFQNSTVAHIDGLNNLKPSNVTNVRGMFNNTRFLTSIDLSNFDMSNAPFLGDTFTDSLVRRVYFYSQEDIVRLEQTFHNTNRIRFMLNP